MEKINFHEIDKNGNHLMRLVGADQEYRISLMIASEIMYKALKAIVTEPNFGLPGRLCVGAGDAIAKAEEKC